MPVMELLNEQLFPFVDVVIKSGSAVAVNDLVKLTSGEVEPFTSTSTTLYGICYTSATGDGTIKARVKVFNQHPTLRSTYYGSAPTIGGNADWDDTNKRWVSGAGDAFIIEYRAGDVANIGQVLAMPKAAALAVV